LDLRGRIRSALPGLRSECPILFTTHHEAHAASAFLASPFPEAAILTVDGVGEWATTAIARGSGAQIEPLEEIHFPHSLGLLYSAFTAYCGFRVNSGEYKLMGLAPYGDPCFADAILREIVDLRPDGSFWLDQRFFDYCAGLKMTSSRFDRLFGGPPRRPDGPLTQREMDLAASIQKILEEIVLRMARHVHAATGLKNLCLAGGVALNCVANGRLLREGPFERLWIQPAAGDAGGALGAALAHWFGHLGNPRVADPLDSQRGSLLGPAYTDAAIDAALAKYAAVAESFASDDALADAVAEHLAAGRIVGHFAGRAEFGPRALGNRSILADPRQPEMQRRLKETQALLSRFSEENGRLAKENDKLVRTRTVRVGASTGGSE
jgi:carbamoyltransferase